MSSLASRLARPEILALPAAATIAGPLGDDRLRLHLNENPEPPLAGDGEAKGANRYPEPRAPRLASALARLYGVGPQNLLVTRGADDAIDILIRSFCACGRDAIAITRPGFAAYGLFATIQGAAIVEVALDETFELDPERLVAGVRADPRIKLVFLCSPNNPTGNIIPPATVQAILDSFDNAIVVLDEAYVDFADVESLSGEAARRDNLVVLRTLSKAYGLAGARIGCAIGNSQIIELIGRALPPFPISAPSLALGLATLDPALRPVHEQRIARIRAERDRLAATLPKAPLVTRVWPSQANFLLVELKDARRGQEALERAGVQVRWRPDIGAGVIRLTIGSEAENDLVLSALGLETDKTTNRRAEIVRKTRETSIALEVDLDREGPRSIDTGIPFFDHMLDQVAAHGGFALVLKCVGDTNVDAHHSIEDVAIALGSAIAKALGEKRGIGRYGFALPMDEADAQVLIDLSGRAYAKFDGTFEASHIGAFPTGMTSHVFRSLADGLRAAVHVRVEGSDDHHKTEACFKAFGRALRQAIRVEGAHLPSTKGRL